MPRDRSAWSSQLALVGIMSLSLFGCGQGEDLAGPDPAALQVTTETSGTGTDPDGYTVSIDGRQPVPIALADTLLEPGVSPGDHTVDLGGIAAGCAVGGGGSRSVTATAGTTAVVDFVVTCTAPVPAPSGAVLVSVATTGEDLDPDGYLLTLDPSHSGTVGSSDQVRIEGVPAGERSIRLSGLAANCSVQGQNPVTIDVPPDGEIGVAFAVRCWPPATGSIAFVRSSLFSDVASIAVVGADGARKDEFSASGSVGAPSWSPDGQFLAFPVDLDNGESTVVVQPVSGGAAAELTGCFPSATRPIWSPSGDRLLCLSTLGFFGGRLWSVERDGSGLRFLTPDDGTLVTSAHFLPDGRIFLIIKDEEGRFAAFRMAADGTAPTRLFGLPEDLDLGGEVVPSPDGQRVAYIRGRFEVEVRRTEAYVADMNGSGALLISADLDVSSSPVWSPDADHVAFTVFGDRGASLWVAAIADAGLGLISLPGDSGFDWSPDGTRLVISVFTQDTDDGRSSIYTIRADGSGLQRLTASHNDGSPAWGP